MSLIMRKPVFGVCDQGRLRPACAAKEARKRLEISDIETWGSEQQRRWSDCVDAQALLFAYVINRFSHDVAHI